MKVRKIPNTSLIWKKDIKNKDQAPTMSIYRDFRVPRLCQFTEILQRFYGAPTMSIYRDFMVPRLCQFTEILQRFYGALTMSIYRDFMVPRLCQFTEILHDKTNPVKSL